MSNSRKVDSAPPAGIEDIDLMLFADGEIDEASAAEIAELLAHDEQAAAKVESLRQMDDVLASYLELAADEQEPRLEALWAGIESQIDVDADAGARQRVSREELDNEPADVWTRPRVKPQPESRGIWSAISDWLEGYRGHVLTGAVAVAAVALLFLALRSESKVVYQPQPSGDGGGSNGQLVPVSNNGTKPCPKPSGTADTTAATPGVIQNGQNGQPETAEPPEIESLDFADGSGYVIQLPSEGEDDVDATVIFVDMNDVEGPL